MFIKRSKYDELNESIVYFAKRLYMFENPPKFKIKDKVKVYKRPHIVTRIEREHDHKDGYYYRYSVTNTIDGYVMTVKESQLKKIKKKHHENQNKT